MLAPSRGFSQLATSFFGIWRQRHPPRALITLTSYVPYGRLVSSALSLSLVGVMVLFYNLPTTQHGGDERI